MATEHEKLELYPTALPSHRAAIGKLVEAYADNPTVVGIAMRAYLEGRRIHRGRHAPQGIAVSRVLDSGADRYIAAPAVTTQVARDHEAWQVVNWGSASTIDQDRKAQLRWRVPQLLGCLAGTVEVIAPGPSTSVEIAEPRPPEVAILPTMCEEVVSPTPQAA